jgi:ATP-dependent DNA helicase RecG
MRCPDLKELLESKEGENIEFKEAKRSFEFDNLVKYACAVANAGGGCIILGVSDRRPRQVVGTSAFPQPERTRAGLIERLHLRFDFVERHSEGKRVLVFLVPPRPVGMPIQDKGIYWARRGDSLVPMPEAELRAIFAESGHDFSADICPKAEFDDLDRDAIEDFRKRWIAKSGNTGLATLTPEQILNDAEAIVRGGITYAALALFGKREALGRLLGQAEVIFEYRSTEASGPADQREEFRRGFFSFYEKLWSLINLRNTKQHYQDGLFMLDVPTFEERIIREAILNAVSHRDYQLGGSIFVRQYPFRLVVDSPGGLPPEVTLENILDRQSPRNRRVADIFARCGLVERSGQGMNLMFELSVKQAKALPDFTGTDRHHVRLTLDGLVQDPKLLSMMERIGQETLHSFSTGDFLVVNHVHREHPVPASLKDRIPKLLDLGVVERVARSRFILGRRFYAAAGKKGIYTRKRGLDRNTNKALLLKHIRENAKTGSKMEEFYEVLPGLNRSQIQVLLRELKAEGGIHVHGVTSAARWYPGEAQDEGRDIRR